MSDKHSLGSATGTASAYMVEVRSILDEPFEHPNGFLVTKDWRRAPIKVNRCDIHLPNFHSGVVGDIPVRNFSGLSGGVEDHLDLLDFEAAYTLACLLQVQADTMRGKSISCRLVEVEVKYSWSANKIGASEEINLFQERCNRKCLPFEEPKEDLEKP